MPRYYLHIREGGRFLEDPDGFEFESLEEAKQEAIESARELLAEKVLNGEVIDGQEFDICDEKGNILARVPFKSTLNFAESSERKAARETRKVVPFSKP